MKHDVWAATAPATLDELDPRPAGSSLLDVKVMMVDDEPLMTDLIQTYLEDAGYSAFVATNDPRQALSLLRSEEPGLLLLDLMMPQMSGFDVLEAIRNDRDLRYTPVIVLTASTGPEAKLRALQLGAADFLAKPVDESELVLRVRNTLAFRQYHDRQINYDLVTGLPNQGLFDRGLDGMLDRRQLVGGHVALFSIQVPECRQLRETVDDATADGFSRVLARRLSLFANDRQLESALATPHDRAPRVGRIGAEQFGVLLEGVPDTDTIEAEARRLITALTEPILIGPHELVATPWMGISVSPSDGVTAQALRRSADLAATHTRATSAGAYQFASRDLNDRLYQRLKLGGQLRGATQRGELRLHYQPKVDLASGRIVGVEALVRWQHPERGLLPPGLFIPLAEELGVIRQLGDWVIERACHDVADWSRQGLGPLQVAVNVAKPQFRAGDLGQFVRQSLQRSGLAAGQLIIELTESMLIDDVQSSLSTMEELKALGVSLSIDDFGTGYSSLSYLKRFPVDELKIDRSFVMDLPGRNADTAIVRTVIALGHSLGMSVTAEGVELPAQRQCLAQLGCDVYQGFLFSRPVPAEQLVVMLCGDPG
ncbi:MAG: EAL domain-containing protein [Vitreoscilla sp.]|nr:EAL domain-containing protein [Vitreoscilla sp.]